MSSHLSNTFYWLRWWLLASKRHFDDLLHIKSPLRWILVLAVIVGGGIGAVFFACPLDIWAEYGGGDQTGVWSCVGGGALRGGGDGGGVGQQPLPDQPALQNPSKSLHPPTLQIGQVCSPNISMRMNIWLYLYQENDTNEYPNVLIWSFWQGWMSEYICIKFVKQKISEYIYLHLEIFYGKLH